MYRPTFALDAIGRDNPKALALAMPIMAEACLFLVRVNELYLRAFPPCACRAVLTRTPEGIWACTRCGQLTYPELYDARGVPQAGVVYDRMVPNGPACGDDDWADLPTVYRLRKADCEDLACIRIAELHVHHGLSAVVPYIFRDISPTARAKHLYHIQVRWPEGLASYPATVKRVEGMLIEDPSEVLGMRAQAA